MNINMLIYVCALKVCSMPSTDVHLISIDIYQLICAERLSSDLHWYIRTYTCWYIWIRALDYVPCLQLMLTWSALIYMSWYVMKALPSYLHWYMTIYMVIYMDMYVGCMFHSFNLFPFDQHWHIWVNTCWRPFSISICVLDVCSMPSSDVFDICGHVYAEYAFIELHWCLCTVVILLWFLPFHFLLPWRYMPIFFILSWF